MSVVVVSNTNYVFPLDPSEVLVDLQYHHFSAVPVYAAYNLSLLIRAACVSKGYSFAFNAELVVLKPCVCF